MTDDKNQDELERELEAESTADEAAQARLNGRQKKTNVVAFVVGATADEEKKEEPPSYAQILAILLQMDDVEYERCRKDKAKEWNIRLQALDRLREEAVRQRREFAPKEPEPDPDDLKRRVGWILETEGILDLWLLSWDKVMAGEHRNAKLLYLICTSRLFDNCMHAAVKGPSSGGKSAITQEVLRFFPPEDVVNFTSMSERALLYHEGDFCHKILAMAEAHGFMEQEFLDYLIRELISNGFITHQVVQKISGQLVTTVITKNGPVSFLVTTTRAALHPENETRLISLEIDDSEAQTRRVLEKLAKTSGQNLKPADSIHFDWQDFQRLLRIAGNKNVVVPFADALAALIPPKATRLRRDFSQVIIGIKTHALLHCCRRKTNEKGELVADLDLDYVPVADLMGHITAEGAGVAVSKELLETIQAVRIATVDIPERDGATAYEIGKKLGLDKSTALRRLRVAAEKGYAVNLEDKRGRPGKYRLTDQEVEEQSLLPSAEEVREYLFSL